MKVLLTPQVAKQIAFFVDKSNVEISGLGRVKRDQNGNMVVSKVYLLEQENSGTSTDIDSQAMGKLQYETLADQEMHGDLNFWWHSHVNMGVFWSGTDTSTIQQFGKNGYLLATVFNKKGETRSAYYQGDNGFLPVIFLDDLKTEILGYQPSSEELTSWESEYTTKCKTKTWATTTTNHHHSTKGGTHTGAYGSRYYYGGYDDYDWEGTVWCDKKRQWVPAAEKEAATTPPPAPGIGDLKKKVTEIQKTMAGINEESRFYKEYQGANSGLTQDDLAIELRRIAREHQAWAELDMWDICIVCDAAEAIYDTDHATIQEAETLFNEMKINVDEVIADFIIACGTLVDRWNQEIIDSENEEKKGVVCDLI